MRSSPASASASDPAAAAAPAAGTAVPGARAALLVLLSINLLNYLDRQVLYALLPLIQIEFGATDTQLGALASAFMLVYMCAAPPIGYLADRSSRTRWIAFGVGAWSLATVFSGLARSYGQLLAARAAVGIGESCYGSVSPSFVAEHFPKERRAGVLALFSMAIPVGSALGYIAGGLLGRELGWRSAFYLAGLPGLLLALLALRLRDPGTRERSGRPQAPRLSEYAGLRRNRSLVCCTLAMAAMTFGMGAMAVWMPTFYHRVWGLDVGKAGTLFGAVTVLSGLVGSLAGGWLADRLLRVHPAAYFLLSGAGLLAAVPFGAAAVLAGSFPVALGALFMAETCAFLNMGPLNAVIVAVTPPRVRSMAFAANIFLIHALGDAVSPTLVGRVSDAWSLRAGLLLAMATLGLAGAFSLWGARYYRDDAALTEAHA
ncbi:MAG: MFS transporter [Elusimicrobia bacterium]|nr:MFS transporter [Elusimicrobiota bacterium]